MEFVLRLSVIAFCLYSLAFCRIALPVAAKLDQLVAIKSEILRYQSFSKQSLLLQKALNANRKIPPCETEAYTGLALIDLQLANANFNESRPETTDGNLDEFAENSSELLKCAPSQSYMWFLRFWTQVLSGQLTEKAWQNAAQSYELAMSEKWINIRRQPVMIRLWPLVPEDLRPKVIAEFRALVADAYSAEAAQSYAHASVDLRRMLVASIEPLSESRKDSFNSEIGKLGLNPLRTREDDRMLERLGPVNLP